MNKDLAYKLANLLMLLASAGFFFYEYGDFGGLVAGETPLSIAMLAVTAILVHLAKSGRLYLALYGLGVGAAEHFKTYCKVTPVSIAVPFKAGELFRMFCYGRLLGSATGGIVIVLLDRFMDTAALISIIMFAGLMLGWRMGPLVFFLMAFLALALAAYHAFPRIYGFWKGYLLKIGATEGRLKTLRLLDGMDGVYQRAEDILKGRGAILFFISLFAWTVEIGSLYIRNAVAGSGGAERLAYRYLEAAVGGGRSAELQKFAVVSIAILAFAYVSIKICGLYAARRSPDGGMGNGSDSGIR